MISPYVFPGLDKAPKNKIVNRVAFERVDEIIYTVCLELELFKSDLTGLSRKRPIVIGRQIANHLIKKYTKLSLTAIGNIFGGRDHSTVIYSIDVVSDLSDTDLKFKQLVEKIEKNLRFKNHGN